MHLESRSYSPQELLRIRDVSEVDKLTQKLRTVLGKNEEMSDIVRRPSEKLPERKLPRIPEETKESSGESLDFPSSRRGRARQLDGTDSEWKYRGRTESEDPEPQPLSAPTGLDAQKDKGFQRFYRAVVSPTHVRVTAGGRIVPNNRGPPSPTTKWSKDRVTPNGSFAHQLPPRPQLEQPSFPLPHGAYGTYPPIYPGFVPGFNPAMAAGHYPLMPWHLGMNVGGSYPVPVAPGMQMPSNAQAPFAKAKDVAKGDKQIETCVSEKSNIHQGSGSEPHDQPRPNFYNGQWMMPPGGQYFPWAMTTPHGFPGSPFAMPMMAAPAMPVHSNARITTMRPSQSAENDVPMSTAAPSTTVAPAYTPSSNPPMSSIRPSEITKRHLDILRARLKYLEDQLSYNKHQIDEKTVENDAQMVRQYISQFEKNLAAQLSVEDSQYPKSERKSDEGGSATANEDNA